MLLAVINYKLGTVIAGLFFTKVMIKADDIWETVLIDKGARLIIVFYLSDIIVAGDVISRISKIIKP